MIHDNQRGFTIIEVLLFFSVSALMLVALMGGVGANINNQRYRDSVSTFAGVLKQQYSEVLNTRNERNGDWKCSAGTVAPNNSFDAQPRGTSDCVLLGRYIKAVGSGTAIETGNVIGSEPPATQQQDTDGLALLDYSPKMVTELGQETHENEWGVQLKNTDGSVSTFLVLILRSPQSGLVRAFAQSSPPATMADMLTPDAAGAKLTICVAGEDGLFTAGGTQAVRLSAAIASPSGVDILGGEKSECE